MTVYERHAVYAMERKKWLHNSNARLPVGTILVVKLNPQDETDQSSKFGQFFYHMGPWVVVERFTNGESYRVGD